MAFEPGPGEIVLAAPAFLALVLIVAAAADAQDVAAHDHARLPVGRRRASLGEQKGVAEFDRRGRPFDVFARKRTRLTSTHSCATRLPSTAVTQQNNTQSSTN